MGDIFITEARQSDLGSLTTSFPRSFHPVNTYQRVAQPDTPKIRAWWYQVFEDEIKDDNCHPIVAIDPSTGKDVGVLTLRRFKADGKGSGFWSMYPLTDDHNKAMCDAFIVVMAEWREELMGGRSHYLVELFGTDHAYKGRGVGSKMLKRACEIADETGDDVFVQANESAIGFYEKFGFKNEGEVLMPGEVKYLETLMVRRYNKA